VSSFLGDFRRGSAEYQRAVSKSLLGYDLTDDEAEALLVVNGQLHRSMRLPTLMDPLVCRIEYCPN
jgi:hypothetical protein